MSTFTNKIINKVYATPENHNLIIPDYSQATEDNHKLLMSLFYKNNDLLTHKQQRKIAFSNALSNEKQKININQYQFKNFIKNKLMINSEYLDYKKIGFQAIQTEKSFDIQDPLTEKPIILH